MSAQESLGKQWQKVYRGIPGHPDDVNLTEAGTHWTPNLDTAKSFAESHFEGTVLEGRVNPSEVVKPHTEEWYRMGGIRPGSENDEMAMAGLSYHDPKSIFDPELSSEKEVTIRPKGLVHISKLHHFVDGIAKSRNINATGQA